jgi:ADP-heptose:LPS heptosyltransferase
LIVQVIYVARSGAAHRLADFVVGVPLLRLAGMIRQRRQIPPNPLRIGVFSPTAIGDLILQSGVLVHLQRSFTAAEIHLLHGETNSEVVPLLPARIEAHCCSFTDVKRTMATIRDIGADLLVDLTPWPRLTALYAACSHATTVGFASQGQHRHYAFDVPVPHLRARHEIDNLRALADALAPCPEYRVCLRRDVPEPALPLPHRQLVLCHTCGAGAQARSKAWPVRNWAELARRLAREGLRVGFTGTAVDAPTVDAVLAHAQLPPEAAFSLCGQLSLPQLAAVLRKATLFITIDTGVLHLAAALDVPTIALHGPTRSARWGGLSASVTSLDAPHPAAGFVHLGFERHLNARSIMETLDVGTVFDAALNALGATQDGALRVSAGILSTSHDMATAP